MTMSHKEALDLVMGKWPWPNDYEGTAKRLEDYIEARGMVLVPRDPNDAVSYVPSHMWQQVLAAAPDPFEEGE